MKNIIVLGLLILVGLLVALGVNITIVNSGTVDAASASSSVLVLGLVLFINAATVGWLYSRKSR